MNISNYSQVLSDENISSSVNSTTKELVINTIRKRDDIKRKIYMCFKRFADIVLSFIGIIISSPLLLAISIAIKLDSKGPAIFKQERIGKNGKNFTMYKFRSMVIGADEKLKNMLESDKEVYEEYKTNKKLKNDPRITRIGKLIRDTSMDELPQLINILKGDMSFIGPRPYLPREIDDMKGNYRKIAKAKPGLTGLWQVSGRSNTSFESRLTMDLYYVENVSLKLDIKILLKTVYIVLKRDGAV